jgi:hypothetical protein
MEWSPGSGQWSFELFVRKFTAGKMRHSTILGHGTVPVRPGKPFCIAASTGTEARGEGPSICLFPGLPQHTQPVSETNLLNQPLAEAQRAHRCDQILQSGRGADS